MKPFIIGLACAAFAMAEVASADANAPLKAPKVYTRNGPPQKTHWKATSSSFAPRPGGTKQRVYGAPIQGKIFNAQPKKASAQPPSGR